MARVRAAATAAGLNIGTRLRRIVGDNIFHKWRWGRVPMAGGGGLVTYRHDLGSSAALEIEDSGVEVRLAVMQSQFGWGAYAVCECRSGERLGWYDGEEITAAQREMLGHMEGREHTIRVSPRQGVPYINGIDGVTGMQYMNTGYGREGRERRTGQPEQIEKMVFRINKRRVVVAVKERQGLEAGEEMRVAYGWTKAVWMEIEARSACSSGSRRGWVEGDERAVVYRDRIGVAYQAV